MCKELLTSDAELVCRALRNALETRPRDSRLLFHSDQSVQYKSNKYRKLLWRYGIMQSMSRRGNSLNNSPMERVFRSLKSEWLPKGGYGDFNHAVRDIKPWIKYELFQCKGISKFIYKNYFFIQQAIPITGMLFIK